MTMKPLVYKKAEVWDATVSNICEQEENLSAPYIALCTALSDGETKLHGLAYRNPKNVDLGEGGGSVR